jgi:hypothetical protein
VSNPDPGERWEKGIPHDPRSEEIVRWIADYDFKHCDDHLCLSIGGDGDNGEHIMYLLDCYFTEKDNPNPESGPTDKVDGMTAWEALDHVKSLREGYNACNGSLYKNVAVDLVQSFLEQCITKWGRRFMECVEREYAEENASLRIVESFRGDAGKRSLVFPDGDKV